MRNRFSLLPLFALLALSCQAENTFRHSITLPAMWRVQPAASPAVKPNLKWGTTDIAQPWYVYNLENPKPSWSADYRKQHCRWYEQTIDIPTDWQGERISIDFEKIDSDAIVFINDKRVGELLTPGGKLDITSFVKSGEKNTIGVYSTRDYTGISRGEEQDLLRKWSRAQYGIKLSGRPIGLRVPITISAVPFDIAIEDIFVITSWRAKTITLEVEVNAVAEIENLRFHVTILDEKRRPALDFQSPVFNVKPGVQSYTFSHEWENPTPWELDAPYLYTLDAKLAKNGQVVDDYPPFKFGFREVYAQGRTMMMNGHPSRWRIGRFTGLNNPAALSYYRLLGYNVNQTGTHPKSWWCGNWGGHDTLPLDSEQITELYDKTGTGLLIGAPPVNPLRDKILSNPSAAKEYRREMNDFIRKNRNHPAILGWSVGMNNYNPHDGIHADTFGQKKYKGDHKLQQQFIQKAMDILKEVDPSRPVYCYADGNMGDIATSNTYLNFAPLQEREDWPSMWAEKGDMPAIPVEFGQPYDANFWKRKRFLMTEYLAKYFGPLAYAAEDENAASRVPARGMKNKGHGNLNQEILDDYPLYWKLLGTFIKNTDRAWRAWGMLAWHYWDFRGFGTPPGYWPNARAQHLQFGRYSKLKEPVTSKPSWANQNVDIYSPTMRPLLVYIAGSPIHTDKTHAFFSGENVKKRIAWIWDGPGKKKLTATWRMENADGTPVAKPPDEQSATTTKELLPGEIAFSPISFKAPRVDKRSTYKLLLEVKEAGKTITTDQFDFQVFPRPEALELDKKVALYDPREKTAPWLEALGVKFDLVDTNADMNAYDIIIVGSGALKPGTRFPVSPEELANGKRVVVLEQSLNVWEGLGFLPEDVMCRRVFIADHSAAICDGLTDSDLENWRGSPDLFPEYKAARNHAFRRAPRSTNRHTVASVMLRLPQTVGFTPIIVGEFDLNYSPLLEWRYGKGAITFCSLDLTDRVGVSPPATILARNILKNAAQNVPQTTPVRYFGGASGKELLRTLQCEQTESSSQLMVIGETIDRTSVDDIIEKIKSGSKALFLPQNKEFYDSIGIKTARRGVFKTQPPEQSPFFESITPNLTRWCDKMDVLAFDGKQPDGFSVYGDGLFALWKHGKGTALFCQIPPGELSRRYLNNEDKTSREKRDNITLSIEHIHQLYARLLTNMGASPSAAQAARLTTLDLGPPYAWIHSWNVLGPFHSKTAKDMITDIFPGENSAIQGDFNPNILFKTKDGRSLDWRRTVAADSNGYVDLKKALDTGNSPSAAYLIHHLDSSDARSARLRIGVDYFAKIWVNGKLAFVMEKLHGTPQPNHFQVDVPLKKGVNVISAKIASGETGFGLWLSVSEHNERQTATNTATETVDLYPQADLTWDPYEYFYW